LTDLPESGVTRAALGEVTLENWRTPPINKWAFHHVRELIPTAQIETGDQTLPLVASPVSISDMEFKGPRDETWTLQQLLSASNTSGFIVVKEDRIVYEQYFNGLTPSRPHLIFSVTKSITGIIAGILAEQGVVRLDADAATYIPEAKGSCFEGCPVQNLLDMSVDTEFTESYLDRHGDYGRYRESIGWNPFTDPESPSDLKRFLTTMKRGNGHHGDAFHYVTPNTDFMGWILERASGKTYAELVSGLLWKPMGAQWDAYVTVDRLGGARAGGGICATLSDLARIGMVMRDAGRALDRTVISDAWIRDTTRGGDRNAWIKGNFSAFLPKGCYRNFWYQTRNAGGAFFALGIHGQWLYVDPKSNVVIAKVSAQEEPENDPLDQILLKAFDLICRTLE
jgi:CubicO group peptidase (beta-lactamase class C family)